MDGICFKDSRYFGGQRLAVELIKILFVVSEIYVIISYFIHGQQAIFLD
jgi:hypothetical protein